MREDLFDAVSPVCPACRHVEKDGPAHGRLSIKEVCRRQGPHVLEGFLACENPGCEALYPVVGGVPVVLKDMAGWWKTEKRWFEKPSCQAPEIGKFFQVLEDARTSGVETRALLGTYLRSHFGQGG